MASHVPTTTLYGLARATRSKSAYAKRMKFLSNSIFGEVRRPTNYESLRLVQMFSRKPYQDRKEIVRVSSHLYAPHGHH